VGLSDIERFRAAITRRLGLQFDDTKLGMLDEVLQRRLKAPKSTSDAYLCQLEQSPSANECGTLAEALTVTETYFFRNHQQFDALAEIVLPERMRAQLPAKRLRVLSAGCASGEEAYSLAITACETIADPSWVVDIRAVDLNPAALAKATRARYSAWALRETPQKIKSEWFRPDGQDAVVVDRARALVTFEALNLTGDDARLWLPQSYDVVFCRNVLMYFSPQQMSTVIARIAHSLVPGGFLFIGHAETLRGVSEAFHLRHTHDTFYYQLRETIELLPPRPVLFAPSARSTIASSATFGDAWIDVIRDASARVAALLPAHRAAPPTVAQRPPARDLAPALELLRKERFAEALDAVGDRSDSDADALILRAVLLLHSGQVTSSEGACSRLLSIDELNAGAHYVLALCREHADDRAGAAEHDRLAAYLDPGFAMPRLHLGLMARRAGDRDDARRELSQALVLLKGEVASRVLLFGGGFNREALLVLCESALRDCGGGS
jgi:chemotaxis protein methyltransferase CheR